MPTPKLFSKQFQLNGDTYLVYRYMDDGNNNYEYQVYKLVKSKEVARELGVSDLKDGRKTKLTTREMWDLAWEKIGEK